MKKALKIAGITLGSLLGLLVIAVTIVVWLVFTPSRLTPIVRNFADKMITCPYEIGQVELTFFSTFPQFMLGIDNVTLIHPQTGAPSDTVLHVDRLNADINLRKLWKDNAIDLHELTLNGADICLFTDSLGNANYDVFASDTTQQTEDTTAFSLPFGAIQLRQITLENANITYVDEKGGIQASTRGTQGQLALQLQDKKAEGQITFSIPSLSVEIGGTSYLSQANLELQLDLNALLDKRELTLRNTLIALNEQFRLQLTGTAALPPNGDIHTDLHIKMAEWPIGELLQLIPDTFQHMLNGLQADGILSLNAHAHGIYNDSTMPLVDATLQFKQGQVNYPALPYQLQAVDADLAAHINLNDSTDNSAVINGLYAETLGSSLRLTGRIDQLMADMDCDVQLTTDLHLPDLKPVLPKDLAAQLNGRTQGNITAKFRMSQLEKQDFEHILLNGKLTFQQLDAVYQNMTVTAPRLECSFQMPNSSTKNKDLRFLGAQLAWNELSFAQGDSLSMETGKTTLSAQTSNLLDDKSLKAECNIHSEKLHAVMDNINTQLKQPDVNASIAMDLTDSLAVPTIKAQLALQELNGTMDTMSVMLQQPQLKATLRPTKRDKHEPILNVDYNGKALQLAMGEAIKVDAQSLGLKVNARHKTGKDNILLEWNPRVSVDLQQGNVAMADFPETIHIPEIVFDYSNRKFTITDSRIQLGNSDFQLKGDVHNINKFMAGTGLLVGELDFVSTTTDVNQLMTLVSGLGSTEEELTDEDTPTTELASNDSTQEETMPFIVPKGVDLTLNTKIDKALVGEQVATNLGGKLYIKDGILVLEEMGFICDAARLQLTAMYQSPRPNHLYVGLDYHMMDIQIEELVKMIPQVDSILPMLRSFRGKGEFHLAAETNLNRHYELKMSTLRGAASIYGKDLVLLDGETFSQIAKLMMFKKKTENKIDSISAEVTVFRNEVDIFPFLVSMDKYKVALGGRHNLDMTFDYHLSLLSPLRIGVNVSGSLDNLKIGLSKCKYAEDFKPVERKVVETQNMSFRQMIRNALTSTVKEE